MVSCGFLKFHKLVLREFGIFCLFALKGVNFRSCRGKGKGETMDGRESEDLS